MALPPKTPAFPPSLSSKSIWESVSREDDDELLDDDEITDNGSDTPVDPNELAEQYRQFKEESSLFTDEFQSDLENLENRWFKQAERLTSFLISPIHDAAARGNISTLDDLINAQGQDVDTRDHVQQTPLHYAAAGGRPEAVTWLLDNGADINAVNLLGDTALHKAVWRRHLEVVKILCARGINRHIINSQKHEAIDLVRDVDIGAEIQSYDPIEEDDFSSRYEFVDEEDSEEA